MAIRRLPKEFRALLRKMGRVGGKRSLETMTPEERTTRARKAGAASVEARRRKAAKKKKKASAKAEPSGPKTG